MGRSKINGLLNHAIPIIIQKPFQVHPTFSGQLSPVTFVPAKYRTTLSGELVLPSEKVSGMPGNINTVTDPNSPTAAVTWIPLTASDNSEAVTVISDHSSGEAFR